MRTIAAAYWASELSGLAFAFRFNRRAVNIMSYQAQPQIQMVVVLS